jgi:hypothetical protein
MANEYAKRQLTRKGIAFEALDNGILSCADRKRLQQICDDLSAQKIDGFLRKWLRLLPHPFDGSGSQGRLSLCHLDLAGRVLADPGARPACPQPRVL